MSTCTWFTPTRVPISHLSYPPLLLLSTLGKPTRTSANAMYMICSLLFIMLITIDPLLPAILGTIYEERQTWNSTYRIIVPPAKTRGRPVPLHQLRRSLAVCLGIFSASIVRKVFASYLRQTPLQRCLLHTPCRCILFNFEENRRVVFSRESCVCTISSAYSYCKSNSSTYDTRYDPVVAY